MGKILSEDVLETMRQASELYNRLVLLVSPIGDKNNEALDKVALSLASKVINVNLEMAQALLELTQKQRKSQTKQLLEKIIRRCVVSSEICGNFVLLNHIEILFDPDLEIDPLALLKEVSRNRVIVAVWKGKIEDGMLTYGQPDYPAFRRYDAKGFLTISTVD